MECVGQQNIKKLCNFYVSDLHLSVMLLPYLSKQVNEDVEITTIFEKLEKENIEKVLEKLNLKNKEKIEEIKWFNNKDTEDKIANTINKCINQNKELIIIVGGTQNFITNNNIKINKYIENKEVNSRIKIINCFNVEEVGGNMKSIVKNYDGILNTSGEIKVCDL